MPSPHSYSHLFIHPYVHLFFCSSICCILSYFSSSGTCALVCSSGLNFYMIFYLLCINTYMCVCVWCIRPVRIDFPHNSSSMIRVLSCGRTSQNKVPLTPISPGSWCTYLKERGCSYWMVHLQQFAIIRQNQKVTRLLKVFNSILTFLFHLFLIDFQKEKLLNWRFLSISLLWCFFLFVL